MFETGRRNIPISESSENYTTAYATSVQTTYKLGFLLLDDLAGRRSSPPRDRRLYLSFDLDLSLLSLDLERSERYVLLRSAMKETRANKINKLAFSLSKLTQNQLKTKLIEEKVISVLSGVFPLYLM